MTTTLKGMKDNRSTKAQTLLALLVAAMLVAPAAQAKARKAVKPRRPMAAAKKASAAQSSALMQAGLDALERKEYTPAINAFSKAARGGGDSGTFFLLGWSYYQRGFMSGDPDTADKADALETVNAYTTAIALDPELEAVAQPYKLYHSLALSYEALGSYEKAVDAYKKAFAAAPHNPMLPLYAARLRYRMSELGKSASNLDIALKKAKEQGQLKALLRTIQTDPKFSIMLASETHLETVRKYDAAAMPPAPSAPARPAASPEAFATAGYGIAAAAPAARAAAPTPEQGRSLASLTPRDPSVRDSVKGSTPFEADRTAELRAQDKDVLDALAAANDEFKFRRYRDAITRYDEALALNEHSGILNQTQIAFIYERVGTSYNKLGLAGEAIANLRRCVQTAPQDAAAHYQLSLAYAVLGRYQESVHALGETFRSAPSTGELKKFMLLAKTDSELEAVRDLPAFRTTIDEHARRAYGTR